MKKILVLLIALPLVWVSCESTLINVVEETTLENSNTYAFPEVSNGKLTGKTNVFNVVVDKNGNAEITTTKRESIETDAFRLYNTTDNKNVDLKKGKAIEVSQEDTWFIPANGSKPVKIEVEDLSKALFHNIEMHCECEGTGGCKLVFDAPTYFCDGDCKGCCKMFVVLKGGKSRYIGGGILIQATNVDYK